MLLGQEFLLSDMLNGLRGNYIVNPWRQVWHFVRFIIKPNGIFYINKAFYVLTILSKDHFLKLLNNSEKVSLGCSNIVL